MDKETKQSIIKEHAIHESDVGSSQVQIAVLTHRIKELTSHLREHPHDHATRHGLRHLVNRRRKLLDYLNGHDHEGYQQLVKKLGLRR